MKDYQNNFKIECNLAQRNRGWDKGFRDFGSLKKLWGQTFELNISDRSLVVFFNESFACLFVYIFCIHFNKKDLPLNSSWIFVVKNQLIDIRKNTKLHI